MSRSEERRPARATRRDRARQAAASASRRADCAPRASARSICACQSAADIGSLCVTASRSETAVAGRCEGRYCGRCAAAPRPRSGSRRRTRRQSAASAAAANKHARRWRGRSAAARAKARARTGSETAQQGQNCRQQEARSAPRGAPYARDELSGPSRPRRNGGRKRPKMTFFLRILGLAFHHPIR